jgi:hypothetical protein
VYYGVFWFTGIGRSRAMAAMVWLPGDGKKILEKMKMRNRNT